MTNIKTSSIQKFIDGNIIKTRQEIDSNTLNQNYRRLQRVSKNLTRFQVDGIRILPSDCKKVLNSPVGTPHLIRHYFYMSEQDINK